MRVATRRPANIETIFRKSKKASGGDDIVHKARNDGQNRIQIPHLKNRFSSVRGLPFVKNNRNAVTTTSRMDIL